MKIEIDIPDLEEIYCGNGYDEYTTGKDFKEVIANIAIHRYIDNLYDDYANDKVYSTIKDDAKALIFENKDEIISKVVDRVSEEILKKKQVVEQMPKKSELSNISKEWEAYFIELIDKAIAKRFK